MANLPYPGSGCDPSYAAENPADYTLTGCPRYEQAEEDPDWTAVLGAILAYTQNSARHRNSLVHDRTFFTPAQVCLSIGEWYSCSFLQE